MLLGLRMAQAMDDAPKSAHEEHVLRFGVPVTKYWICKRANHVALEALECQGGSGYVEEGPAPRLLREAPLNSIWEGTAAMMGLDFQRALRKGGEPMDALFAELDTAGSADRAYSAYVERLKTLLAKGVGEHESELRRGMSMTAVALQASLMIRHSSSDAADAFVQSRLGGEWGLEFGTLSADQASLRRIVDRAWPTSP